MSSTNNNAEFGMDLDAPERLYDPEEQQVPVGEVEADAGQESDDTEGEDSSEDEEGDHDEEDDNPDESKMAITEDERNLAISIKHAIAAAPDVDPVSDFMCVQLALMDGDNTENAVERAYHLQCFREEYGIHDTAEAGRRCFAKYLELFPKFHLSFSEVDGSYVVVWDNKVFKASRIQSEDNVQTWLGGTYYTAAALTPHFCAIRNGAVLVAECEGYDWKQGLDFKSLKRMWSEIGTVYPVNFAKAKYFHSGTTMNLVFSLLKPFMPKQLRSVIEFGCRFPQRLDQVYLVPTNEEADVRFLQRIEETLRKRFDNEQNFRL